MTNANEAKRMVNEYNAKAQAMRVERAEEFCNGYADVNIRENALRGKNQAYLSYEGKGISKAIAEIIAEKMVEAGYTIKMLDRGIEVSW